MSHLVPQPVQSDSLAGMFSSGCWYYADKMFNVSWLTSLIGLTGRKAAHCTGLPNYCSLRGVQQIYGQWEECCVPTFTPHARIKLTICNLNRLNTSREKRNRLRRVPQEINSEARWRLPLSLCLSFSPSSSSSSSSSSTSLFLSLTGGTFSSLMALFLITGPLSCSLSSALWHLTWHRFPLSKEWNHLSGEWASAI